MRTVLSKRLSLLVLAFVCQASLGEALDISGYVSFFSDPSMQRANPPTSLGYILHVDICRNNDGFPCVASCFISASPSPGYSNRFKFRKLNVAHLFGDNGLRIVFPPDQLSMAGWKIIAVVPEVLELGSLPNVVVNILRSNELSVQEREPIFSTALREPDESRALYMLTEASRGSDEVASQFKIKGNEYLITQGRHADAYALFENMTVNELSIGTNDKIKRLAVAANSARAAFQANHDPMFAAKALRFAGMEAELSGYSPAAALMAINIPMDGAKITTGNSDGSSITDTEITAFIKSHGEVQKEFLETCSKLEVPNMPEVTVGSLPQVVRALRNNIPACLK